MTYEVKDLMARFNVTQTTILCWISSGELKAINVGRKPGLKKPRWRITEQALEDFELSRQTISPQSKRKRSRKQDAETIEFYK